jgi:hypothetical protein
MDVDWQSDELEIYSVDVSRFDANGGCDRVKLGPILKMDN